MKKQKNKYSIKNYCTESFRKRIWFCTETFGFDVG